MKRLAVCVLACLCVLATGTRSRSQTLKERSLTETPASQPAPSQQPPPVVTPAPTPQAAPAQQPAASHQPAAAQPAAPAVQPAQVQQPAPVPQAAPVQQPAAQPGGAVQPAPPSVASPPPGGPGQPGPGGVPPAGPGGTPINGSTAVSPPPPPPPPPPSPGATYKRSEINREVMGFFEGGSSGLAQLVAKAFREQGQPSGFIKGNEAGGALVVGLRYGSGTLFLKGFPPMPVYWQSPSLGFDLGVNAVKVFTLVYGMHNPDEIFQRYPGVDGSLYVIGGFGMNYQRSGPITLAPIRFGVGLRLGAAVGYQNYSRNSTINPF